MNNIRYTGSFQDVKGVVWKIDIYKEGYNEEAEELLLGENPLTINYSSDNDIFKPIRYSSASINILTDHILKDLYTTKLDCKINIYKDNNLWWIGYVTPNLYNQDYYSMADEITLECIDFLSALRYKEYNIPKFKKTIFNVDVLSLKIIGNNILYNTTTDSNQKLFKKDVVYIIEQIYEIGIISDEVVIYIVFYLNGKTYTFTKGRTQTIVDAIDDFYNLNSGILISVNNDIISFEANDIIDTCKFIQKNPNQTINPDFAFFQHIEVEHQLKNIIDIITEYLEPDTIYYFSENIDDVNNVKIDEKAFCDEEEKPYKVNEILENYCKVLGVTIFLFNGKLYIVDPILYSSIRNSYSVSKFREFYKEDNEYKTRNIDVNLHFFTPSIGENNSTIEYSESYNQVNVISNNGGNLVNNDLYLKNKFYNEKSFINGDYKYFMREYISESLKNYNVPYAFNESGIFSYDVYNGAGGKRYWVDYSPTDKLMQKASTIIECKSYDKKLKFPHAQYKEAVRISLKDTDFFSRLHKYIVFGSKANEVLSFKIKVPPIISDISCAIDASMLFSQYDYINENANKDDILLRKGYLYNEVGESLDNLNTPFGISLKCENKFWNDRFKLWSPLSSVNSLCVGDENTNVKSNTWYNIFDSTPQTDEETNLTGFYFTIPKEFSDKEIEVSFSVYPWASQDVNTFTIVNMYHDHQSASHTYSIDDLRNMDVNTLKRTIFSDDTYSYSPVIYNYNQILGVNIIQYIFISDLKYSFDLNAKNGDLKYSTNLDNTVVEETNDINCIFASINESISNNPSYNYVYYGDNLMTSIFRNGYFLPFELHLVNKYYNWFKQPKLIHTNTFEGIEIEPCDGYIVNYIGDKPFIVADIEYDIKYNKSNIRGYEL